jgi:hypothetical protein
MAKKVNPSTTTKYDGGVIERFLKLCSEGGSVPEFCLQENICRTTFDLWCEKYHAMMTAKKKGKSIAEGWWLKQARMHLVIHNVTEKRGFDSTTETTKFDTALYKHIVGGRFGHTSDKDAHDRLDKLEQQVQSQSQTTKTNSAYADIAECEDDDNPPE